MSVYGEEFRWEEGGGGGGVMRVDMACMKLGFMGIMHYGVREGQIRLLVSHRVDVYSSQGAA